MMPHNEWLARQQIEYSKTTEELANQIDMIARDGEKHLKKRWLKMPMSKLPRGRKIVK